MFRWDGSYLGSITDANITIVDTHVSPPSPSPPPSPGPIHLREPVGEGLTPYLYFSPAPSPQRRNSWYTPPIYWRIRIGTEEATCLSRPIVNHFPLIIDELKRVFHLNPLGTHSVTKGTQLYILIKAPMDRDGIIEEISLSKADIDPKANSLFTQQVQELFCFRDILALSSTWESSLRVRRYPKRAQYPISYRETKMRMDTHKHIISNRVMQKWFADTTLGSVARRMVGYIPGRDLSPMIATIRTQIETTINRIDRDAIWCSVFIIDRLINRLLSP